MSSNHSRSFHHFFSFSAISTTGLSDLYISLNSNLSAWQLTEQTISQSYESFVSHQTSKDISDTFNKQYVSC
jgi:hypothetical protein